ncbi:MAG TPA: PfkB family carbohydrate kinase [Thermoleophilaceae bacterium]|nr:PfkB family carbohydrate kinase [Thermoleophilaceae bacterium]
MRVAVIGHVEWMEFARVERVPLQGEIVEASGFFAEPAGGGAVAAVQLARLAGACDFFTALGDDDLARASIARLSALGVTVHPAKRPGPTRRGWVYVDERGERTITVIGPKLVPALDDPLSWDALDSADAVFFVAGAPGVLERARAGRLLTATARSLPPGPAVRLDAAIGSSRDPAEAFTPDDLVPPAGLCVWTEGAEGGRWAAADGGDGRYAAAPLPGAVADAYGCGDSFAAGVTFGLADGRPVEEALALGARCGAEALTRRGPYA